MMPALPTDQTTDLREAVRSIPDFPKPGISFKDITPLLGNARLFAQATDEMAGPFSGEGITHVVAIESRGFILGGPVARALGAGFIPVRKPGKLPYRTEGIEYALEYGSDRLEVHVDACGARARVLIVDDVLATGGTAAATCTLLERVGAEVVGCSFLLEIGPLGGRKALSRRRIHAVLGY
jgi:adenine phosphoribosyltransferase